MPRKPLDEMKAPELRDLVRAAVSNLSLYRCEECGALNMQGFICIECGHDDSIPKEER